MNAQVEISVPIKRQTVKHSMIQQFVNGCTLKIHIFKLRKEKRKKRLIKEKVCLVDIHIAALLR